jgi:acyl-coenzyme A synthetase/AMP-(fatty) acid ligase
MKYLRQLAHAVPAAELYNLYGPTETNVCTYYCVDRARLEDLDRLPIGKACANTQVFALDEHDKPVEPGMLGELYVRGPSVTHGYWGDPEKTARAVIPNRFQGRPSENVYRTGDVVLLDGTGDYHFVARRDGMIKSRGYRIELGEVEAALYSHSAVVEAVAVAVPDDEIGNRIRAFVAVGDASVTSQDLQKHCAERIPSYMIPEVIQIRDRLPQTSTGKFDRKQLTAEALSMKET